MAWRNQFVEIEHLNIVLPQIRAILQISNIYITTDLILSIRETRATVPRGDNGNLKKFLFDNFHFIGTDTIYYSSVFYIHFTPPDFIADILKEQFSKTLCNFMGNSISLKPSIHKIIHPNQTEISFGHADSRWRGSDEKFLSEPCIESTFNKSR